MISLRTYWFDLLAVQGTLESLLQLHSEKASILLYGLILIYETAISLQGINPREVKTCIYIKRVRKSSGQ